MVGVHHTEGRAAHWSGLERCASIWSCPVCSAVIRNERAREIQEAADRWAEVGGSVVMATLTMRHYRRDPLAVTLDQALQGWRDLMAHRGFKALRKRLRVAGYVRAVEVTWSWVNGWHPHIHVLLFLGDTISDDGLQALEVEVFDLWQSAVMKRGGRSLLRKHGVRISRGASAEYVAKVQEHDRGTGLEMARHDLKQGRAGSLMPFELLDSSEHRSEWLEYVDATWRRRAITWSQGLRTLLGLDAERTDEEVLADVETSDLVGLIDGPAYDAMRNDPLRLARVLETAEGGGEVET